MNKFVFIVFILFFILLNFSIILGITNSKNLITNYFRIHIVANSDNIDDQILKLNISKEVNEYIQTITLGLNNKEACIQAITKNINNILLIANNIIRDSGYDYPVTAYIGNLRYDKKTYNRINMDAGIYNSLKIVIGQGYGENWWSLLFPNSISTYDPHLDSKTKDVTFKSGFLETFLGLLQIDFPSK